MGIEVISGVLGAMLTERPQLGWHMSMIVSLGGFANTKKFNKHQLSLLGLELKDKTDIHEWLHNYSSNKNGLWLPVEEG